VHSPKIIVGKQINLLLTSKVLYLIKDGKQLKMQVFSRQKNKYIKKYAKNKKNSFLNIVKNVKHLEMYQTIKIMINKKSLKRYQH
jgi:hypothetical protein